LKLPPPPCAVLLVKMLLWLNFRLRTVMEIVAMQPLLMDNIPPPGQTWRAGRSPFSLMIFPAINHPFFSSGTCMSLKFLGPSTWSWLSSK
jgi:hypothetical protein